MTLGRMSKLCKCEEGHQDPREAQGLVDAQLSGAEEEAAISPSSSISSSSSILFLDTLEEVAVAATPSPPQSPQSACPSPTAMAATPWSQSEDDGSSSQDEEGPSAWEDPEDAESTLHNALRLKMADLVGFPAPQLSHKGANHQGGNAEYGHERLPGPLPSDLQPSLECMQLVFGVDLKKVDPSDRSYFLVTTLGLTYDAMLSGEQSMPKTILLLLLLGVILLEGDCTPEEDVWEVLSVMGVCAWMEHFIYRKPRELLTKVWVQERYVEYRQVPASNPACYEFLWGPRAHAETSKIQVLEYLLRVRSRDSGPFLHLSVEGVSHKEEGA